MRTSSRLRLEYETTDEGITFYGGGNKYVVPNETLKAFRNSPEGINLAKEIGLHLFRDAVKAEVLMSKLKLKS